MDNEKGFYEVDNSSEDIGDLLGTSSSYDTESSSIYDEDYGEMGSGTEIFKEFNSNLGEVGTQIDVEDDVFSSPEDINVELKEGDLLEVSIDESSESVDEDVSPDTLDLSGIDIGDIDDISVEESNSIESGEDLVSSEEKMRIFSDQIISSCIGNRDITKYALDKLTMVANPRLFRDENYIIFSIFYVYRSRLRYINIDSEFIKLFLNRMNLKLVLRNT